MAEEQNRSRLGRILLDPVRLQQQTKYKVNGLTVTSNNENIMPRDAAGNIIFHESSSKNPLLIVEPVDTKIMLSSVLKVFDTRFEYFKFPVTITPDETAVEDLTIDLSVAEVAGPDNVYARYRPSEVRKIPFGSPTAWWEGEKFSGVLMDFVEDGVSQKETNWYQITKEIKESGIDLRFRIQIRHKFETPSPPPRRYPFGYVLSSSDVAFISDELLADAPAGSRIEVEYSEDSTIITLYLPVEKGTAYFSIIRNTPEIPVGGWPPALNKLFRGPFANTSELAPDTFGSITQYEEQTLNIDVVIRNEEFEIGDYFQIGAYAGQNEEFTFHTILPIQTYWVITDASKNVDEWNQEIE